MTNRRKQSNRRKLSTHPKVSTQLRRSNRRWLEVRWTHRQLSMIDDITTTESIRTRKDRKVRRTKNSDWFDTEVSEITMADTIWLLKLDKRNVLVSLFLTCCHIPFTNAFSTFEEIMWLTKARWRALGKSIAIWKMHAKIGCGNFALDKKLYSLRFMTIYFIIYCISVNTVLMCY